MASSSTSTPTPLLPPPPLPERPAPALAAAAPSAAMPSRPLSELSENEDRRRSSHRLSHPRSLKDTSRPTSRPASRPTSQVLDDKNDTRLSGQIQTITLNLNDYAAAVKRSSIVSNKSRDSLVSNGSTPGPSKPRPERPGLNLRTTSISSIKEIQPDKEPEEDSKDAHPLLAARRASLRPSPLGATYADVLKPLSPSNDSVQSLDSVSVSVAVSGGPAIKPKPSWLRRASGTSALRSKSKSPVQQQPEMTASTSLPPALPPRKVSNSYASVVAGPSRSRLGDGEGRPAISAPVSTVPSREGSSIRDRISAWTQPGMSRSDSSATLASLAPSTYSRQERFTSAQRMIGSAGSAVQKGWAGLRSRGVGGSISSMSQLAGPRRESLEPPRISRKASRDRSVSAQATMSVPDGPVLDGAVRRQAGYRAGLVFGKDISVVGKEWGVVDEQGLSEWEKRRRAVLPAVVVRCVDYLTIWGPKEEGMFRISGRSSHVSRLRKEFDSGADLDLRECHPGDVDPHAVSGTLKSYLRELPLPLLATLQPKFEAALREKQDMGGLLQELPVAYWFLLADLVNLLSLIASHTETNRMTIKSVMLSLGPSLNIPGNVLAELMKHRAQLFATPPKQQVAELIDFGDSIPLDIPDPISRSSTPASEAPIPPEKPKRSPLLPNKPSLTRLFGAPSAPNMVRCGSADTHASVSSLVPPRVELCTDSPRLPSFESDRPESQLPLEPIISASSTMQDVQYRPGTVEERAKAFATGSTTATATATPIADMFAGQSSLPPLRHQRSGLLASTSVPTVAHSAPSMGLSSSTNPATVVRRGQGGFFGGGAHARSQSLATNTNVNGIKKKEVDKEDGKMLPPPLPARPGVKE